MYGTKKEKSKQEKKIINFLLQFWLPNKYLISFPDRV